MAGKRYHIKPQELLLQGVPTFEGLDIPINEDDKKRIDRLVDLYESRILSHLNEVYQQRTRWSDRLADRIAKFGGSWTFILCFSGLLVLWMVINSLPAWPHFDPFPFILLNLLLSC
ncbi:MAG: DUF1003 domain-containing protein, partial [Alicyclobacillus sp.]|nr:DUF1003 domain-containing protein [Alicyclobacillus sp.]